MKKLSLTTLLLACLHILATAQGQQNIWAFGDKAGLDFNTGSPATASNNLFPGEEGCASICDAGGQLLFYSDGYWVWDRLHQLMPRQTGGTAGYSAPVALSVGYPPLMPYTGASATQSSAITAAPAHPGIYYLLSLSTTGQLFYSVIDMSLHGGYGDIVNGKMGIYLAGGLTEKMTVTNGCSNEWLITRARATNQYRAFEINDTGIVTAPVISVCGSFPTAWYRQGTIKVSPDGSHMAAACNAAGTGTGGLELYELDIVSGRVTNAVVLDSSSSTGYYYGTCFSPDNTKLYATVSSFSSGGMFYPGTVRQFNVSLPTPAAMAASNTLLYTDAVTLPDNMGDLKRASDGKIYLGSGRPAPPYAPYMHRINAPNATGVGCGFTANAVALPAGIWSYRGLPNDVALLPPPDTVRSVRYISACFRDSITLTADTGRRYSWQAGGHSRNYTAHGDGIYTVGFIDTACKYQADTYSVHFVRLPLVAGNGYSCTGKRQGTAWLIPAAGDTSTFAITWADNSGNILRLHTGRGADTVTGLDTGTYAVHIQTTGGCDTILGYRILPISSPTASATADSILCLGSSAAFNATTNGDMWTWAFGDGTTATALSTSHRYGDTGTYDAAFITKNIAGCSDTINRRIYVRSFTITLSADRLLVNRGEPVRLETSGSGPYSVTEWLPAAMFPHQSAMDQVVSMDTTRTFTVYGVSSDGCTDSASLPVAVNPVIFLPSAFTPNGDGSNDRFRPVSYGSVLIRDFAIYNRWGQLVFHAFGTMAAEGWDGRYHGIAAEIGAYFYTIDMETPSGGSIALKGDVTLIR